MVSADLIFEDDFSNAAQSNLNWSVVSADENSLRFVSGMAELSNNHPLYAALALHSFEAPLSEFTFSATVISSVPGAGLFFCVESNDQGYKGYAVLIGDDLLYFCKYYPGNIVQLGAHSSPFLRNGTNRISIAKQGARISVFCNGYYVFSQIDSEFGPGDIALIAQAASEVSFDDVQIFSEPWDTLRFEDFRDSFSDSVAFGWSHEGSGVAKRENGVLGIETGAFQQNFMGISVPLSGFMVRVAVMFTEGDTESLYGLYLQTEPEDSVYRFAIRASGEYAIMQNNAVVLSGRCVSIRGNAAVNGSLPADTLVLMVDSGGVVFSINGDTLYEHSVHQGIYRCAGVFANNSLKLRFDDFQLINYGFSGPTEIPIYRSKRVKHPASAHGYNMFDLAGRVQKTSHAGVLVSGFRVIRSNERRERTVLRTFLQ